MAFCLQGRGSALDSLTLLTNRLTIFKKKKKGTWGRGGAEGIRSTEMSAELCAARLVLTYCQRVNAMMEN